MARVSKNYDKVTHAASDKDSKGKQKAVWDMIGAKKKLQEMVEALINGDSTAAAASLHDYLQVKTRSILGETDHEEDSDDEMVADRHEDDEDEDHEEGECPECHMDPCECSDDEVDSDAEDGHEDEDFEDEHGEDVMGEGARGDAVANDSSVRTRMKKNSAGAKDLTSSIKGHNNFKKSSGNGTKSDSSGAKKTSMKKNSMGAKDLESRVKGNIKFDKKGKAKLTKPFNNAAPGLDRKVKGEVKY
jgi:hypothetical protein